MCGRFLFLASRSAFRRFLLTFLFLFLVGRVPFRLRPPEEISPLTFWNTITGEQRKWQYYLPRNVENIFLLLWHLVSRLRLRVRGRNNCNRSKPTKITVLPPSSVSLRTFVWDKSFGYRKQCAHKHGLEAIIRTPSRWARTAKIRKRRRDRSRAAKMDKKAAAEECK